MGLTESLGRNSASASGNASSLGGETARSELTSLEAEAGASPVQAAPADRGAGWVAAASAGDEGPGSAGAALPASLVSSLEASFEKPFARGTNTLTYRSGAAGAEDEGGDADRPKTSKAPLPAPGGGGGGEGGAYVDDGGWAEDPEAPGPPPDKTRVCTEEHTARLRRACYECAVM